MDELRRAIRPNHLIAIGVAAALSGLGACSSGASDVAETTVTELAAASSPAVPSTTESATTATTDPSPTAAATVTITTTAPPPPVEVAFERAVIAQWGLQGDDQGLVAPFIFAGDVSGDLVGTVTDVVLTGWATNGSATIGLSWFEGSVADCGAGGMALRTGERPDGSTGWEVVPGLGIGDLGEVAGSGINDGPSSTGTITCHGQPGFSTTLLTPTPTDPGALDCTPPDSEADVLVLSQDTPMHAEHLVPARMRAERWEAPDETYVLLVLEPPSGTSTRLYNTSVGLRLGPACGHDLVARTILDNLMYFGYQGAWDVLPAANGGLVGGGAIPGSGKLVVPPG